MDVRGMNERREVSAHAVPWNTRGRNEVHPSIQPASSHRAGGRARAHVHATRKAIVLATCLKLFEISCFCAGGRGKSGWMPAQGGSCLLWRIQMSKVMPRTARSFKSLFPALSYVESTQTVVHDLLLRLMTKYRLLINWCFTSNRQCNYNWSSIGVHAPALNNKKGYTRLPGRFVLFSSPNTKPIIKISVQQRQIMEHLDENSSRMLQRNEDIHIKLLLGLRL